MGFISKNFVLSHFRYRCFPEIFLSAIEVGELYLTGSVTINGTSAIGFRTLVQIEEHRCKIVEQALQLTERRCKITEQGCHFT